MRQFFYSNTYLPPTTNHIIAYIIHNYNRLVKRFGFFMSVFFNILVIFIANIVDFWLFYGVIISLFFSLQYKAFPQLLRTEGKQKKIERNNIWISILPIHTYYLIVWRESLLLSLRSECLFYLLTL